MNPIAKYWEIISNLGLTTEVSILEAKRIKLTNRLGMISVFFTLPYLLGYAFLGFGTAALFSFWCCIIYVFIPYLSSIRFYTLAKLTLFLGVLFHQFVLASFFGPRSEIHVIYIALVLLPVVLFDVKEEIQWVLFCIGMTIVSTALLYITDFSLLHSPEISDVFAERINVAYKFTTVVGCYIILFSSIDVAEKTEKIIGKSNVRLEAQFKAIFNASFDALFLIDLKAKKFIKANRRAAELFEMANEREFVGYDRAAFNKEKLSIGQEKAIRNAIESKGYYEGEMVFKTKKGNEFWGSMSIRPVSVDEKMYHSVRVTDITSQKKFEQEIQSSLHEKEILLSEIHHRVKNNLAVISGLLGLQSRIIEDEKSKNLFEESRNRIHSMALIHDKLYQNESLAKIDFNSYITDLVQHIQKSYSSLTTELKFVINCNDIFIDIKNAVPCGLILNELISNSNKHAFKDRESGEIKVDCTKAGKVFTMIVSDNGNGYDFEKGLVNPNSLGLTLVNALTEQLNGHMKTTFENGTVINISFEA